MDHKHPPTNPIGWLTWTTNQAPEVVPPNTDVQQVPGHQGSRWLLRRLTNLANQRNEGTKISKSSVRSVRSLLVVRMLLVAMPGAPSSDALASSSILAPSSKARSP